MELEELRPHDFPEYLWRWFADSQKPLVRSRFERYPEPRRSEVIRHILTMDVCKDGDRAAEEPMFRALMLANIVSFFHVDDDNTDRISMLNVA